MDTISKVQTDGYTIFLKVINFIFKYKVWYKNYFASKINIGYNYSLRRVTSRGRELPRNTKEILANFISENETLCRDYGRENIFNMDEANFQLDSSCNLKFLINF